MNEIILIATILLIIVVELVFLAPKIEAKMHFGCIPIKEQRSK